MVKNIIVCCDGTSNNFKNNTHISRLAYMFQESSTQIIYYISGVGGEEKPLYEKIIELALGTGLRNRLYRTYNFLVDNYEPNDRIYLFGFSRGSYTIRALAGMINKVGILNRAVFGQNYTKEFLINQALDLSLVEKHEKQQETDEDHGTASFKKLYTHDLSKQENKIEFMGAFDTVGTLGVWGGLYSFSWIKGLAFLGTLGFVVYYLFVTIVCWFDNILGVKSADTLSTIANYWHLIIPLWLGFVYKAWNAREREEFYNHTLSSIIKKALHITAKDEKRVAFRGIPMDAAIKSKNQVETFDIAGVHADIGGGYYYNKSGHCSLLIMLNSIKKFAKDIDICSIRKTEVLNAYENAKTINLNAYKKINDSATFWWLSTNMIAPRSIKQWIDSKINILTNNKYLKKIKYFLDNTIIINALYKFICWLIRPIMYMFVNLVVTILNCNKKLFADFCLNLIALMIIFVSVCYIYNHKQDIKDYIQKKDECLVMNEKPQNTFIEKNCSFLEKHCPFDFVLNYDR
jgi:hypothetical protein